MESQAIEIISRSIFKKFPEFSGTKPKVRLQSSPQISGSAKAPPSTYLLTFENKVSIAGGKNMTRWVRVTATREGKILKVSTSR